MKVQYKHPDSLLGVDLDWVDVDFGDNKDHLDDTAGKTASLKMEFMPVGRIDNPKLLYQFYSFKNRKRHAGTVELCRGGIQVERLSVIDQG